MADTASAPEITSRRGPDERADNPFAAAFRASRMAMLVTDARKSDNPIAFVNDAFTDLTGYSRAEVIGRNCRFLQGHDTDMVTVERIRTAISRGEGIETEILNYRKDGSEFWNLLVISPVCDQDGKLQYFLSSQYDVSQQKMAESELIRVKGLLEEKVSRRTQDLQLALDQKTALLHEVDHRVKNSLQMISSLVLLKARRMKEEPARRVLHNLAERISALSTAYRLLYSVGDVSRFDLAEFMADLSGELITLLPPGQVDLDLQIAPVAVSAAKAAPLALLVNEVLSNAVKHAYPDGRQGKILVGVTRNGNEIRIVIEDDGIGIRGDAPRDQGLGKTLIDMLVRQLKGRLDWEDAAPGTRAVIVMPLDAEEAQL